MNVARLVVGTTSSYAHGTHTPTHTLFSTPYRDQPNGWSRHCRFEDWSGSRGGLVGATVTAWHSTSSTSGATGASSLT